MHSCRAVVVVLALLTGCAALDATPSGEVGDSQPAADGGPVLSVASGDLVVGSPVEPNSLDDPIADPQTVAAVEDGLAFIDRAVVDPGLRRTAIARLRLGGRTVDEASCIVEQLVEAGAVVVLESEVLGLGGDPIEAAAIAHCA